MIAVADVGGTKIRYGTYEGGRLKVLGEVRTPKDEPIWKKLYELFKGLEADTVSLATMGPLKLSEGKIVSNPHSEIKEQELAGPLMRSLKKEVIMVNDAVAGAYAEFRNRNVENLVYVAFGTGVGVGAVVDGKLLLGREGNAHEMGHAVLALGSGLKCGCGKEGHAEALLGGSNLPKFFKRLGFDVTSAKEAFELMRRNERAFELFSNALNSFLASLVVAYDPEILVLGGGVYFKNADVFSRALEGLPSYLLWEPPSVEPALFGELSPLYGAGLLGEERPDWLMRKLRYVSFPPHP